jgi:hypothetical protein
VALTGVERAHAERVSTLNVREHVEPFSPGGRMRVELFATEEIEMTRLRRLLLSVVVAAFVALPTAGSALAGLTATAAD